jgi:hypothetical protein
MELFDKKIPLLPIDSPQESYDSLLKDFSNLDQSYVFNASCIERRQYIQEAYDKCKEYLDDDFHIQIKIPGKFISRLWELQLCSIFLFYNLNLVKPLSGKKKISRPDFCILDSDGNKIWIEAVCPDLGGVPKKEEMISGVMYTRHGNIKDDLDIVAPRITSSIQSKYSKRESYSRSSDFNLSDKYVIAINTHHISHRETGEMPKELVFYGMGLQWIKQNHESGRHFHWTIPKQKEDGTTIDLDVALFFRKEFKNLSAVITSSNWFKFGEGFEESMSKDIITYINHDAENKVKPKEISFGKKKQMFCKGEFCELKEV